MGDRYPNNKLKQLVEDLSNGTMSVRQIETALRRHYRHHKNLPTETIDLLCGAGESDPGLIAGHFALLRETIGSIELAVRRSRDRGSESG